MNEQPLPTHLCFLGGHEYWKKTPSTFHYVPRDLGADFEEDCRFSVERPSGLPFIKDKACFLTLEKTLEDINLAEASFKAFLDHVEGLPKVAERVLVLEPDLGIEGAGTLFQRARKTFRHILHMKGKTITQACGPFRAGSGVFTEGVDYSSECRLNLRYKPGYLTIYGKDHAAKLLKALDAGVDCEELEFNGDTPFLRFHSETRAFSTLELTGDAGVRAGLDAILGFDEGTFEPLRHAQFMRELRYRLDLARQAETQPSPRS
jgi:hypothetical protein